MFLTRNACRDLPLVYGDPGTPKGSRVFGTGDLDFGFGWGPAVGATYRLNACNRVGVEFYAIDSWSSTNQVMGNYSVQFPSLPYLPELDTPGDLSSGHGVATFHYGSRLYNTELNVYHRSRNIGWLTMLAGFRWMELGEDFSTVFDTGDISPRYAINVYNHLYGAQLGMLTEVPNPSAWELDGWLKAGLYGNRANQDTTEDFTSDGGVVTHAAARDSNAAFVGDLGITAKRAITDRLSFSVSYMALWVEGIALAPEQLDNSDPSSATVSLDNGGGTFYHGGFVGGEYRW